MRNESGIALPLVMGLLVAVSLIGIGLLSQTVTSTKFFEAASISYIGLQKAQQKLNENVAITDLATAVGEDQAGAITVLYAVPVPAIGGTAHGTVVGNVWRPGLCGVFYQNTKSVDWTTDPAAGTLTDSFYSTGRKGLDESAFLFKDQAGPNDTDVLDTWTNYTLHVEFNAGLSPDFGVYYNSGATNDTQGKPAITGYLFRVSPIYDTFSITKVDNGNLNPGSSYQSRSFSDSSLVDANGNNPFTDWASGTAAGTGSPYDAWHSIDVVVTSQADSTHVITAKVDGVTIFSFPEIKNPHFQPNLIGLSNWSGEGWGTASAPSTVTWRNIMVTNTAPTQ